MGFRFWRRIKIAPGLTLNLSKSGGSLSFGPRGAKFTVGSRGKRATVGIPGTGLFYTSTLPSDKSSNRKFPSKKISQPVVRSEDRLTMGFFKRLITPRDEEALVDGCRELVLENENKALNHLKKAVHLADGAYLAGFLSLKKERFEEASEYLSTANDRSKELCRYFNKYGISPTMSLPITEEVSVHVGPNIRGVLLGLVEIYQRLTRWEDAIECLNRLRRMEPEDVVIKLSLAEILMESKSGEPNVNKRIIQLTEGVENESEVHAALLFYKAKALRNLKLFVAARDVLTKALRRKKDRSTELLHALRYERALAYEDLGQQKRSRNEFEKLYVEAPDYEDVAIKLGLK